MPSVSIWGWLEQELTVDTSCWTQHSGGTVDEWDLCAYLEFQCGPVLERRYATWITPADVDTLATADVNVFASRLRALLGLTFRGLSYIMEMKSRFYPTSPPTLSTNTTCMLSLTSTRFLEGLMGFLSEKQADTMDGLITRQPFRIFFEGCRCRNFIHSKL